MPMSWLRFVVLAALFGAVATAPAADEPTKKELETATNYLKQIVLGFHNYADAHDGRWADDITDKDGRILLSWRVALLPHIDEQKLYEEFKLDEPWDSANNKKLVAKMPKMYAPVRVKAKAGETYYQRFIGKGTIFGEKGASTLSEVTDGLSNTALVFEAGDPVIWSQPGDLPFGEKRPLPKLGGLFDGVVHVGMCDGSVLRCKKDFDADEMKMLIMPADGNVINIDKLTK